MKIVDRGSNDRLGALRLHLGCFDQPVQGWVNTDITPHLWVTRFPGLPALLFRIGRMTAQRFEQHKKGIFKSVTYLDVRKPFPYMNNTFEAVFSSHLLEHLYPSEAEACVEEIYRILKPGGICRISVPDLDRVVASYSPNQPELFLTAILQCDRWAKNTHHWHYNSNSLLRLLREKSFSDAYRCSHRQGRCPDLELLDNRPDESLFVEAVK